MIFGVYISYFPTPSLSESGYDTQVVEFVAAKKVKTGIYDVTVAFLDKNFKRIKVGACDSVVTVFGYDTYIIKEPVWAKYYTFNTKRNNPDMVILWPLTEKKDYRRMGLPFTEVLYEEGYIAQPK